jgi:hypothetical protein
MGAKKVRFVKNSYAMSKGYTKVCSVKINFVGTSFFLLICDVNTTDHGTYIIRNLHFN